MKVIIFLIVLLSMTQLDGQLRKAEIVQNNSEAGRFLIELHKLLRNVSIRNKDEQLRIKLQNLPDPNILNTVVFPPQNPNFDCLRNPSSTLPLITAIANDSESCVPLLLQAGADPLCLDEENKTTPLHFASSYRSNDYGFNYRPNEYPPHKDICPPWNHFGILPERARTIFKYLLDATPKELIDTPDPSEDGLSPFFRAALDGNDAEIITSLIEAGADIFQRHPKYGHALGQTLTKANHHCFKALLKAINKTDPNHQNRDLQLKKIKNFLEEKIKNSYTYFMKILNKWHLNHIDITSFLKQELSPKLVYLNDLQRLYENMPFLSDRYESGAITEKSRNTFLSKCSIAQRYMAMLGVVQEVEESNNLAI